MKRVISYKVIGRLNFNSSIFTSKKNRNPLCTMCTLWCICIFLFSCERRELIYYSTAEVTLTADWSRANLDYEESYGATVIFYPHDGSAPRVVLMGDRTYETARLPVGKYDAILFNRSFDDFGNIAFRGRETLATFEAYSTKVETKTVGQTKGTKETREIITAPPERIASAVLRDFEVTEGMLGNYDGAATTRDIVDKLHFTPSEQTHSLPVRVSIRGVKNIRNAKCTVSGVSGSFFLGSGVPGNTTLTQEFGLGKPVLDAGSITDGYMESTVNIFGLDKEAPHEIRITALLVDGSTVVEQIISESHITEKEDGNGAIYFYIEATAPEVIPDVKEEGSTDSSFDASVDDWGEEENEEIVL